MSDAEVYTGTDNLEVMADAHRYNAYLVDLAAANLPPGGRCLDFGAGIGTFAMEIAALGFDVTAFDTEPSHVIAMRASGLHTIGSLAEAGDGAFDGAWSFNVLEHISDDVAALQGLHRVLKPGATLVVYVPALMWLWSSMDDKVEHYRRYTRADLASKLEATGFDVERCRYADSLGIAATLAYKAVGDKEGSLDRRSVRFYDSFAFPVSRFLDRAMGRVGGKNVFAIARRV